MEEPFMISFKKRRHAVKIPSNPKSKIDKYIYI